MFRVSVTHTEIFVDFYVMGIDYTFQRYKKQLHSGQRTTYTFLSKITTVSGTL